MKAIIAPLLCLLCCTSFAIGQGSTKQVSLNSDGESGNRFSYAPAISSNGEHIAFWSTAFNLGDPLGDSNGQADVFVRHLNTGITEVASLNIFGQFPTGASEGASISSLGDFVAFESTANDLVFSDTNGQKDVFVRDFNTGITELVSVTSGGVQGNSSSFHASISGDGRFVAFQSWASNLIPNDFNGWQDVFLHDRQLGTTICLSLDSAGVPGNGFSTDPKVSNDGNFIVFVSSSNNLVPGDLNNLPDIFVFDRLAGTLELGSVNSFGVQGDASSNFPTISSDGRFIAYESASTNLSANDLNSTLDVFWHDRISGSTELVSQSSAGAPGVANSFTPSISANGNQIAFRSVSENLVSGDSNLVGDIFLHNRSNGITTRASVDSYGRQASSGAPAHDAPAISSDGAWVAFQSDHPFVSTDTGDLSIYLHSVLTNENSILLTGPGTASVGSQATFTWSDAPWNEPFAFLFSTNSFGSQLRGHAFEVGPPVTVFQTGISDAQGAGSLSGIIPPSLAGSTLYVELGAAVGVATFDSNMLTLVIP